MARSSITVFLPKSSQYVCRFQKFGLRLSTSYYTVLHGKGDIQYNWINGAESLEKYMYKPGGYHPVTIGDMLHERYRVVDKLGFGGYSTVWLRYVAVKVGIANSPPHESKFLQALLVPQPSSLSTHSASNVRLEQNCHTPLAMRPPAARFEPQSPLSFIYLESGHEIVAQQIDVLGPMPPSWWERWDERSQFFNHDGHPREDRDVWPPMNEAFKEGIQKYRRKRGMGMFEWDEMAAILDLMRRMLAFPPEQRPTVEEALK
ncbi:hypothetical protein ACJ73_02393 [Blastomyces percursus]|uniref:non-specific serine/threonine protein kinase n=1 Tax=Blastomyces percursus TaxID=1658174 RepID=A0A1J9RCI4_9EURO|nr:hypothetical protein ACJ73_02393 [Blastomyces percursus]